MEEGILYYGKDFFECIFLLMERLSCGAAEGFWSMVTRISYLLLCFTLCYSIEVAGWKYPLMEHATAPFFRCWERLPVVLLPEPGFLVTVIYSYTCASKTD